ncbi:helix-turn-helix domain-containing protein [Chryseobacterium vrystaatense]|nr:AraC family transcriptional regulator [Chryseobacterium vrystaatense]
MNDIKELMHKVDEHEDSILFLSQQLEQALPPHEHQKGQLLLVFGGIAYLQTREKDFYIPSNHYIWIPGAYTHSLMFNAQDLHITNIYFPSTDKYDDPFYNELGIYPVSKLLSEILNFAGQWYGNYFEGSWEYEVLSTLKHLLPKENLKKFSIQLPTTDDVRLKKITAYIKDNLQEALTLAHIADQFGLSIRSTTRLFNEKLQISFVQYVKMLRVIHAMQLLKDSDMSISEIAYEVGYSSIAAFSNTFQQLTNLRPTEFKSMIQ